MHKHNFFDFGLEPQRDWTVRLHTVSHQRHSNSLLTGVLLQKCWVLDYSLDNCGGCRVGETGDWLPRSAGWAHLYRPGTVYREDTRVPGEHESTFVTFDGAEEIGLDELTDPARGFARIYDPAGRLGEKLTALAALGAARGNQGLLGAMAIFWQLADELVHYTTPDLGGVRWLHRLAEQPQLPRGNAWTGAVRHYLEVHFREQVSLAAMAKSLGMSVSSLSHRYRSEAGESVFTTLLRIRVEQSLPLLHAGERLKQIAAAVGFADEFYYSRTFKRFFGTAPAYYRKNIDAATNWACHDRVSAKNPERFSGRGGY